ncbi:MAG TPA: hypothetical protein VED20_13015 [Streptosporangiaceae bacterium]|nr:hypothetical protein [Streptosporangiaceae bacterium]
MQRDFDRATEEASTALAMFRDLGDVEGTAWSLISLGTIARCQGEAERASALLTESRSLSEGIGFREGIAWACEQLGLLAAVDGDPAAIVLLRRSLDLHGELRDRWRMSSVLEDLAAIALALDRARPAARLLGAAEAVRDAIGTVIAPCERPQHLQTAAAVQAALGEETFAADRQQGLLATMDELAAELPSAEDASSVTPARAGPPANGPAPGGPAQDGPAATGPAGQAAAPARRRPPQPAARSGEAPAGPLRIRALGGAVVEFGGRARTAARHRRLRRRLPRRHGGRRMGAGTPGRASPGLRVGPAGHRQAAGRGRPPSGRRGAVPPGGGARAAQRHGPPGADEQLGPPRRDGPCDQALRRAGRAAARPGGGAPGRRDHGAVRAVGGRILTSPAARAAPGVSPGSPGAGLPH